MFNAQSPGWPALKEMLDEMIEQARTALEQPIDLDQTNINRGRIAALRDLTARIEGPPAGTKPPRYT